EQVARAPVEREPRPDRGLEPAAADVAVPPLAGEAEPLGGAAADAGVDPPRLARAQPQVELDPRVRRIDEGRHLHLAEEPGLVQALDRALDARLTVVLPLGQDHLAPDHALADRQLVDRRDPHLAVAEPRPLLDLVADGDVERV